LDIVDDEQIDVTKTLTLEESEITILNNDELYVNIHSNLVPSGLMRGQIR